MTTDLVSLLPLNATPQERALEMATRVRGQLHTAVDATLSFKEDPPDSALLWLVWEYGLEELLAYLPGPRAALDSGLLWQRIRGTPESIHVALAWLGLDSTVEEEETGGRHWFEYQLDPGRVPTREELRNLLGLARLSAPVGTRLARVFHGLDNRRFIWDQNRWSDGSLWSNYSGFYDPDSGAYLSFLEAWKTAVEMGERPTTNGITLRLASAVHVNGSNRWDDFKWGDGLPLLNHRATVRVALGFQGDAERQEVQPEAKVTATTLEFEQYSWGSATWGNRNWTQPATPEELGA